MGRKSLHEKTAIVYCRTSTKGQKDAATIDVQVDHGRKIVKDHAVTVLPYGPRGDGWLLDDGVSGSLLDGREFAQLIDDLQHGRLHPVPDYLITYSMSRLARHDKTSKDMAKLVKSATDKARIMAVLNGAGVRILDQDGVNDPASVLTEIKETLSAEEYRAIRKRTMDGKARVLKEGAWATGGRVPYGYKRVFRNGKDKKDGTTLAPCEVDGPRFIALMREYVEGGAAHAARYAMLQGWLSPRGSKTWYPSTVQQLLRNISAYRGSTTLSIDGQTFEVTFPALIDFELYAAIKRRMKEYTKTKRTTLLATGYCDCGECGGHVHGTRSSTREHFFVSCRARCLRLREDNFAGALWMACIVRLVQIRAHEKKSTKGGANAYKAELAEAKAKLNVVQEQIDRLVGLYAEAKMDRQALDTNSARLRDQKAVMQAEVGRLEAMKAEHEKQRANRETVEARVEKIITDLMRNEPGLERRRQILADVLQGGRAIVLPKVAEKKLPLVEKGGRYAEITLPPFGSLPPLTISTARYIHEQTDAVLSEDILSRLISAGHAGVGLLVHPTLAESISKAKARVA